MYSSKSGLIVSTLRTRRSTFSSGPSSLQLSCQEQHLVQIVRMSLSCTCQSVWTFAWGAPAHATRRVRAGVWVLGHISRCFVRVRVAGRQDWLLPRMCRRRSGRAVRRPRSHDDDAMPGVDAVDAWMDEPDAPIGGPRTSVVCLITI